MNSERFISYNMGVVVKIDIGHVGLWQNLKLRPFGRNYSKLSNE
jgi:hypothetical protein